MRGWRPKGRRPLLTRSPAFVASRSVDVWDS